MRSARLSRWLLAAWLLFATDAAHANPAWPDALHAQVQRLARGFEGEFTLLVKDLQHGKVYGYNAEAPFYLASVVKVFVMREVYRQAELGTLRLDEEIVVSAESLRDGAGEVKGAAPGTRYTVSDLLKRMITQSDNTATDLLIERVGLDAVNRSVQELGGVDMGNITSMLDVRRKVYGRLSPKASTLSPSQVFELWKIRSLDARARALARMLGEPERRWRARDLEGAFTAYYADLENSAPMDAVGHLLESIVRCTGMRQESCDSMLATLKACETGRDRVRAGLPPDAVFAHKTGTQHRRVCDVGVLYLAEERPVVIAACVKEFRKAQAADALLARLGRVTYEALKEPPASLEVGGIDAGPPVR